jgi:hypothetical protein
MAELLAVLLERLASTVRGAQVSKMRLGVWDAGIGTVRNQIFRELEQFRLRINALQKRAELPERKNAPA